MHRWIFALALCGGFFYGLAHPLAHSFYDPECCSGDDCSPVEEDTIKETLNGYQVPTGEIIPYTDKRVRQSIDRSMHWCHIGGATFCIYVPGRSF